MQDDSNFNKSSPDIIIIAPQDEENKEPVEEEKSQNFLRKSSKLS